MGKKLYYKIGEACKELDIQPYVLRYWETEFSALSPSKSKSGQRVYSAEDLELIGRIKELLYKEGYTIAGAKKKLDSEAASRPHPADELAEEELLEDGGESVEEVAEEPSVEASQAKPPARAKPRKAAKKKASAKGRSSAPQDKTLARLRQGIEEALREAKEILEILDRS